MASIGQLHYGTVTIANGATTSGAIETKAGNDMALVGIITPAALTGVAFTFTACHTDSAGTFNTVYNTAGTAYSVTVGTSRFIAIDPVDFAGVSFLKVVSGSAEGAARSIVLVFRRVH